MMDLNSNIVYQGCLLGVQRYDFTNDSGSQVRGVSLHVSTQIPSDSGFGHSSKKYNYKGDYSDFETIKSLVGKQVLCHLNNGNGVLKLQAVK
jgi:hypothetical protein